VSRKQTNRKTEVWDAPNVVGKIFQQEKKSRGKKFIRIRNPGNVKVPEDSVGRGR